MKVAGGSIYQIEPFDDERRLKSWLAAPLRVIVLAIVCVVPAVKVRVSAEETLLGKL